MTPRPEQLALALSWRPALGRDDFLVAPSNAAAVALIDAWPAWPGPAACLVGAAGAGKTHLAQVFAHKARARPAVLARDRAASGLDHQDPLALFEGGAALVLEDADLWLADGPGRGTGSETDPTANPAPAPTPIPVPAPAPTTATATATATALGAGRRLRERTLFHLLNAARQERGYLLLTAQQPPARWPVALADLASRLRALPTCTLGPPDETLLGAVLLKQFADRGLDVGPEVIAWLLPRMPRDFASLRRLVARADALALARGRAVTLPLMREALAEEMP